MKPFILLALTALIFIGCATSPEQQRADQLRRDAERQERQKREHDEREARLKRETLERERRHKEEIDRERQKYSHLGSDEIRVRLASLSQEISAGYFGYGWGLLVAKSIYDGKVKEREALMMELVRRGDAAEGGNVAAVQDPNQPRGSGTGFFITEDGYFVTCAHVVKDSRRITVKMSSFEYPATLVRLDPANDVAVLKVSGKFSAIPQTSSKGVKLGQSVFTIGFPNPDVQGVEPKLTRGDISSLAGLQDDPRFFQISVPTQPGNSGGPILDEQGNVVGILTAKLRDSVAIRTTGAIAQNVNYATKSSLLATVLESIPEISPKLKAPHDSGNRKFEDVVSETQPAVAMILAY